MKKTPYAGKPDSQIYFSLAAVPQITDNSSLKIFSGTEITINLFGIPVQTVKATGFYSLEAQKTASPFWRLLIGNDGQNSVKSDILGLSGDLVLDHLKYLLTGLSAYLYQVLPGLQPGNIKVDDLICLYIS
jgi:hypothetical protein